MGSPAAHETFPDRLQWALYIRFGFFCQQSTIYHAFQIDMEYGRLTFKDERIAEIPILDEILQFPHNFNWTIL
jgi:hypothetical protein